MPPFFHLSLAVVHTPQRRVSLFFLFSLLNNARAGLRAPHLSRVDFIRRRLSALFTQSFIWWTDSQRLFCLFVRGGGCLFPPSLTASVFSLSALDDLTLLLAACKPLKLLCAALVCLPPRMREPVGVSERERE